MSVSFTISMHFTGGKGCNIEYWNFKYNDKKLRKKYADEIIKATHKMLIGMGFEISPGIIDFTWLDRDSLRASGIHRNIMMDIKEKGNGWYDVS